MPAKKITCLVPLLDEPGPVEASSRLLLDLCRVVVVQAKGSIEVELISCGRCSTLQTLHDGLGLRILPVAAPPVEPFDALSWDVPAALADADLVHIHHIFTRLGEVGMLAAKLQRKPVCVSDTGIASSRLGTETGILALADRVILFSELQEGSLAASGLQLLEIYFDLVPSLRNRAA